MATSFVTHVQTGVHGSRPAASSVPQGTLFACTTHSLIYQSDGSSTWSTWYGTSGVSSFGSNVNAVGEANSAGASASNTRADHVHLGVRSVAHASNTFSGPVILTASSPIGITSPTPGTLNISSSAVAGGSALTVQDEGSPLSTAASTLNFTGAGVTASGSGATKTIDIPGGGGGSLTLLHTVTLGADAASIGQSGISGSYKDLIIVCKLRGTTSAEVIDIRMRVGNSSVDTGSNYAEQSGFTGSGNGSSNTGATSSFYCGPATAASSTSGLFYSFDITIFDYAATSTYRRVSGKGFHMSTSRYVQVTDGMWKNASAAIDIISFFPDSNNFLAGSRLYIYGRS